MQSPLVPAKVLPQVVLSGIAVGCVPSDCPNPLIHTHSSLDLLKDRNFTLSSRSLRFAEHMTFPSAGLKEYLH